MKKRKKINPAQVLEEYMNQTEQEPALSATAQNRLAANTSTERPALLPTPTLPVYNLKTST